MIGHENLTKPDIAAAIEKAKAKRAERTELTSDMVVDELRKIGFANMADYMKSTPLGDPYLDFSALTPAQTAALSEVTVEDYVEGRGEDARQVKRVKFKLHDKQAALVALARHLGMFDPKARQPPKVEVNIADVRASVLSRLARITAAQNAEAGDPGDEPRTITEVPTAVELVEREAAAAAARPKAEYAPGSLEYQGATAPSRGTGTHCSGFIKAHVCRRPTAQAAPAGRNRLGRLSHPGVWPAPSSGISAPCTSAGRVAKTARSRRSPRIGIRVQNVSRPQDETEPISKRKTDVSRLHRGAR